jgi:hypothetical protein
MIRGIAVKYIVTNNIAALPRKMYLNLLLSKL